MPQLSITEKQSPFYFQLCSTHYTVLQINNRTRSVTGTTLPQLYTNVYTVVEEEMGHKGGLDFFTVQHCFGSRHFSPTAAATNAWHCGLPKP